MRVVATGAGEARTLLDGVVDRTGNLAGAWPGVADRLLEGQRRFYLTGGGGDWPEVDADTRAQDRREGRDPRPMIVSGELMASVSERGARGQVLQMRDDFMLLGTALERAEYLGRLGFEAMGEPTGRDVAAVAAHVGLWILTARR